MREELAKLLYEGQDRDLSGLAPIDLADCYKLVDAILDALLEPSEEMVKAGESSDGELGAFLPSEVKCIFRAMVKAAKQ